VRGRPTGAIDPSGLGTEDGGYEFPDWYNDPGYQDLSPEGRYEVDRALTSEDLPVSGDPVELLDFIGGFSSESQDTIVRLMGYDPETAFDETPSPDQVNAGFRSAVVTVLLFPFLMFEAISSPEGLEKAGLRLRQIEESYAAPPSTMGEAMSREKGAQIAEGFLFFAALLDFPSVQGSVRAIPKVERSVKLLPSGAAADISAIARSLDETGKLPIGYTRKGYLQGGKPFKDTENRLPKAVGRWREADVGDIRVGQNESRGSERIVYDEAGNIYYSPDHFQTDFVPIRTGRR
jgi:hypothetical protein